MTWDEGQGGKGKELGCEAALLTQNHTDKARRYEINVSCNADLSSKIPPKVSIQYNSLTTSTLMKPIIHNLQYILLYPSIWVSLQPTDEKMQVEGNSYE